MPNISFDALLADAAPLLPDPPTDTPIPSSPITRRLTLEDALAYLDLIKVESWDKPSIYDGFLLIMKNFKSREIDTPGVIDRVSRLLNGHTTLLQGFNTFLPPGYHLDCTVSHYNHSFITVATPHGTTVQTVGAPLGDVLSGRHSSPAPSSAPAYPALPDDSISLLSSLIPQDYHDNAGDIEASDFVID